MIGTIAGAIIGKVREDEPLIGGFCGFIVDLALVGAGAGIWGLTFIPVNLDATNSRIAIEKNVANSANFGKFTGNAYTVTSQEGKNYLEMFGIAIQKAGDEPTFSSVTYDIDQYTYDQIFKYVDIKYSYGTSGQLIGAENELRAPEWFFGGTKAVRAEREILKRLEDVTKQTPVSIRFFSKVNETVKSFNDTSTEDSTYLIAGLGAVNLNDKKDKLSFTVDVVDSKDPYKLAKRLMIVQNMTDEIKQNPTKAYLNFADGKNECMIFACDAGKEIEYHETDNGKGYAVELTKWPGYNDEMSL